MKTGKVFTHTENFQTNSNYLANSLWCMSRLRTPLLEHAEWCGMLEPLSNPPKPLLNPPEPLLNPPKPS